jgi:uncharacterized protein YbcI
MTVQGQQRDQPSGSLSLAISNAIVALVREYTGRGPTKARTIINGDIVMVILQDGLTKGEQALVRKGRGEKVLDIRALFQQAMHDDCVARVNEITGRQVTAMMSANHVDPDIAAEIFVLEDSQESDAA